MATAPAQSQLSCPQTSDLINRLPGFCGDYAWGDALFSLHLPGTHLPAHCSADNLRIRIHLGIDIPEGSEIRVGNETRAWREGKCLVFDDSFEHETWNRSEHARLILIVDLWNPGLTLVERQALLAGFNSLPVKKLIFMKRMKNIDAPAEWLRQLQDQLQPLARKFAGDVC
jgi:aspartyl/asparaginyl beta-hydroxylase (cupin superfamily)